jgi:broad specificity phosphatase PhoE
MRLTVMRHSFTELNEQEKIQGRIDLPLSKNGILHASEMASKIDNLTFDIIASSPLIRALQTANIFAKHHHYHLPITIIQSLMERDFGMLDRVSVHESPPYVTGKKRIEGYEIDEDFLVRIQEGLDILYALHKDKHVLLFAHAHVIKAIMKLTLKEKISFSETKISHHDVVEFSMNPLLSFIKKTSY